MRVKAMRFNLILVSAVFVIGISAFAAADYKIPVPTVGQFINVFAFTCQQIKQCPAHVLIDSAGNEKGVPGNPVVTAEAPYQQAPLGFQVLSNLPVSTTLAVPAGAAFAKICVEGVAVRYRDDGVAPTATVGMPLAPLLSLTSQPGCMQYAGTLSALQFIQQAPGASMDVS